MAFFIVHFMNVLHASTCPLLWGLYDDNTACHNLSFLQRFLNLSEIKFVHTSETVLQGSPYSGRIILCVFIMLTVLNPSTSFTNRNLLW